MQYGDKKVRYAIIEKDGHLHEVVGAQYVNLSANYLDNQPKPLVKIKNNGSTTNNITLTDTGTNGSYIIKNDSKYVSNFGWIDSNAVSIPSGETIATNGQNSTKDKNIVSGNDGQFEVIDWSNCSGESLGYAYYNAKCIKKVPDDWPENITSLYRTLAGITIDNIPNWTNANTVIDISELFNGTTINQDLKIDGMISSLKNANNLKKLLNNCTINNYSYTGDEYKFYSLYKALLPKIKDITNVAACFGGTQYDEESKTYTDSYNYAVRFKYTDSNGQTANVIPPDLMYIPKEWGGFEHNTFAYVSINDSSFSIKKLTITDAHLDWNLGDYKTLKYSDSNWIISGNRDFYSSTSIVVECINENTSETTFVIIDKYGSKDISWPDTLNTNDSYTIKIHVYLENPDSKSKPEISDGKIVTDWHEYYLKSDEEYRGTDGVYTRTGLVPFDESIYDITKCTIDIDSYEKYQKTISWKVYNLDKRIDDGSNPPDKYEIIFTNIADNTIQYIYGTNSEHLITSVIISLYSIESGVCIDADGNIVSNIPDGSYSINIKAYKNEDYCEKNAVIDIKDCESFWTDIRIVQDEAAIENNLFKWTVEKKINDEYVSVMDSYLKTSYWLYIWNNETEDWDLLSNATMSPTELSIDSETYSDGKYKLDIKVFSKCHDKSYYPNDKIVRVESLYIEKITQETYTEVNPESSNGVIALGVYLTEETINGFNFWSTNMDTTTTGNTTIWIAKQTDITSTSTKTLQTKAIFGTNIEYDGIETTGLVTKTGNAIYKMNWKIPNGITLESGYYLFCMRKPYQWNWQNIPYIKCSDDTKYNKGIIFDVSEWALNRTLDGMWQDNGFVTNKYTEVIFEKY